VAFCPSAYLDICPLAEVSWSLEKPSSPLIEHDGLIHFEERLISPVPLLDQMKPRTVYEKAVQDFTKTARRLARLDQHFRQTSFAEFTMLMTVR